MVKNSKKEISNKVTFYNSSGAKDGTFQLDKDIFTGKYNPSLIYQVIVMYNANKRKGGASTKVSSDVRGGGKKPWRQKGTGRARTSSIRNPIWRGGGIIFGPHPRSFKQSVPKKIKRLALLHSLNSKLKDGLFGVIKEVKVAEPKTKKIVNILNKTNLRGSILVAVDQRDRNLFLATRNIKNITVAPYTEINAMDVLKHNNFIMTEKAVEAFVKIQKGRK